MGGISLPTLFFHDDESPLLTKSSPPRDQNNPRSQWGFPPFLTLLQFRSTLLRSRLLASRQIAGAELWLVNPSKADREVHENGVEEQIAPREAKQRHGSATVRRDPYPPKVALDNMAVLDQTRPRQTIMTGLSNITTFSRKMGQQILSHPLAQPVVPHLPPAVRSLINVPGEWERSGRLPPKTGRSHEVASEFESARLYLARWARVVAEEGERARRTEVASHADLNPGERVGAEDLASSLGVFSLLASPNSKRPIPHPIRTPQHPITARDWSSFAAQGRDELWVRREIFKRGFSDSIEPEEQATRREGWEVVIGSVPWAVGGIGGGEAGKERRRKARTEARVAKREEFTRLQKKWRAEAEASGDIEAIKEEWHRIDVCSSAILILSSVDANDRLIAGVRIGISVSLRYPPMRFARGTRRRKRAVRGMGGMARVKRRRAGLPG